MAEYIEREATIELYCQKCKGYYDGHCIHRGECDVDVIRTAPAADVQPVRHGRWESSQRAIETGTVNCSNCAIEYYISDLQMVGDCNGIVHYCPNCGADMRGEKND